MGTRRDGNTSPVPTLAIVACLPDGGSAVLMTLEDSGTAEAVLPLLWRRGIHAVIRGVPEAGPPPSLAPFAGRDARGQPSGAGRATVAA
jgi:hypothetical protein